jgi:hypothetical protein
MIRWTDLIGLVGFVMAALGTFLLFSTSGENMHWDYRLGGLALWLAGLAADRGSPVLAPG